MVNKILLILVLFLFGCSSETVSLGMQDDIYLPNKKKQAEERALGYEVPPVLKAKDLLSVSQRESEIHKVKEDVYSDGFYNHYTVETKWGKFYAGSNEKLKIRLNEINAIEALQQISTAGAVVEGVEAGGKKIVMAPVHAVVAVGNAIVHPVDTTRKIVSIPMGVVDFFAGVSRKVEEGKEDLKEESENGDNSSRMSSALDAGLGYAQNWIGYDDHVRELERRFGILPDTDNELLKDEIRRIARIKTGFTFSTKFVPGVPMFDAISDANKVLGMVNKISIYEDRIVQEQKVYEELIKIGLTDEKIRKFQKSSNLDVGAKTSITNAIINLEGVKGRELLIDYAMNLDTDEAGMIYSAMVSTLPFLAKRYGFSRFITDAPLPTAVTRGGKVVVSMPTDYLFWTKTLATIVRGVLDVSKKEADVRAYELVISGRLSKRTALELSNNQIKVAHLEVMLGKGFHTPIVE